MRLTHPPAPEPAVLPIRVRQPRRPLPPSERSHHPRVHRTAPAPMPARTDPSKKHRVSSGRRSCCRARWAGRVSLAGLLLIAAMLLSGSAAHADPAVVVVAQAASVDQVMTNARNWLVGILAGLATVFLSLGGVRYMLANGDPGEIAKAKEAFRGAGVGYALAALAPLVVTVLKGIVGV